MQVHCHAMPCLTWQWVSGMRGDVVEIIPCNGPGPRRRALRAHRQAGTLHVRSHLGSFKTAKIKIAGCRIIPLLVSLLGSGGVKPRDMRLAPLACHFQDLGISSLKGHDAAILFLAWRVYRKSGHSSASIQIQVWGDLIYETFSTLLTLERHSSRSRGRVTGPMS